VPQRRGRIIAAVLVTALVLAAAGAFALAALVADAEYEHVDARLAAELSGVVRAVDRLGREAHARAVRRASDPAVQRALVAGDRGRLEALSEPGESFELRGRRLTGRLASPLRFAVVIGSAGDELGRVVVPVPEDALRRRAAVVAGDRVVVGRLLATGTVTLAGRRVRAAATRRAGTPLAVVTAAAPIEARIAERRERFLWAVAASFAALVLIASLVAQLIRPAARPLRRAIDEPPVRRGRRQRAAATLVGNALAAGHDRHALVPVILDSAVAVTGASGARLVADGEEIARAGVVRVGRPPLVFALSQGSGQEAQLVLDPPVRGDFDDEAIQLAEWLAGRASIALQNAHLHVIARRLASTDELTQLANRRHFDEALSAEVIRAERFGDPIAVVVADLDNFKEINDRFGHDVGDRVLQSFADVIRANVRDVDLPARYGGEEFTVLLPGTDAEGGRQLAERLRVVLEELPVVAGEVTVSVTSSFGVAGFPDEPSAAALLRAGDRALYRAKAAGKNAVFVADGAQAVRA
jgi:diguanylate cyclase (GGDEF)-like protein